MKNIRDTLYLISSYSIRSGFLPKAEKYTSIGMKLFPSDQRLLELRSLVLLNLGQFDDAEKLVTTAPKETSNINYIKVRTGILLHMSEDVRKDRIRAYLTSIR